MILLEKNAGETLIRQILNSQDPETAINEVFRFIRKYLPLDFMTLPVYDSRRGILRYRAFTNNEGVFFTDEPVRLSKDAKKEADRIMHQKMKFFESYLDNPVSKTVTSYFGLKEQDVCSGISVFTDLGSSRYGVLSFAARGRNRHTPEHLRIIEELYGSITEVTRHILSQMEIVNLKEYITLVNEEIRERFMGRRIIGSTTGLKEVLTLVEQAAPLDIPILITGETGVGKEVVASIIHQRSKRSDGPMISINCGAIPDTLLDSELFGHEKGAFTSADAMKQGYFERADRGTIFLDEIGELTLQAQVKLLRVIQDMTFQRVGGKRFITVDVRVIAATNRNLESLIAELQFRKDLWFRLNVFPIQVPPLRERLIDIPALAVYFARRQTIEMNLPYQPRFATGAMEQLQAYDWPGNVRELQNVIERALITNRGEPMTFPNLAGTSPAEPTIAALPEDTSYPTLDEITARYIRQTLMKTGGRISGKGGAADLLGMNPSTLRSRMRKLYIKVKKIPGNP
ncbi:MAG: sigma-54 dependent transcriptional regulator [Deltaproteobacteria bacterium]|nr:sigma-54 dependent transcriptional regulator [Deltaproteobacteria bacterium]